MTLRSKPTKHLAETYWERPLQASSWQPNVIYLRTKRKKWSYIIKFENGLANGGATISSSRKTITWYRLLQTLKLEWKKIFNIITWRLNSQRLVHQITRRKSSIQNIFHIVSRPKIRRTFMSQFDSSHNLPHIKILISFNHSLVCLIGKSTVLKSVIKSLRKIKMSST